MASDATNEAPTLLAAYEEAVDHLAAADKLVERAGEGNLLPADMAALAQAHVFVGMGKMLHAAFAEEFAEEMAEER